MYPKIRAVHLSAGAFALVYLVLYAISAVQMTHPTWIRMTPRTTNSDVALPPAITDARLASRELAALHGISGELSDIRVKPEGLDFRVLRPGKVWQVSYKRVSGAARVRLTDTGTVGAFNRIHQMRGTWHTWTAYNLWAVLLAAVGTALFTLGITGVLLWWESHRDRRWTGALFAIAPIVSAGLAAWMRA